MSRAFATRVTLAIGREDPGEFGKSHGRVTRGGCRLSDLRQPGQGVSDHLQAPPAGMGMLALTLVCAGSIGLIGSPSVTLRSAAAGLRSCCCRAGSGNPAFALPLQQNLNAMAVKLGEMQAQLTRLDALGERLSSIAGAATSASPRRLAWRRAGICCRRRTCRSPNSVKSWRSCRARSRPAATARRPDAQLFEQAVEAPAADHDAGRRVVQRVELCGASTPSPGSGHAEESIPADNGSSGGAPRAW